MTKTMLNQEWAMGLDELIESEAQAQAICMATQDFRRAFEAFAAKREARVRGRLMTASGIAAPAATDSARACSTGRSSTRRIAPFAERPRRASRPDALARRRPCATSTRPAARWRAQLGEAGLLDACVAPPEGDAPAIDSRGVCLARETLAWHDGLADFAFAMQGLGSGAVALAGLDGS